MPGAKIGCIIPIYNVDQYLGECLESVSKAAELFEIKYHLSIQTILTDDGACDFSSEICDEYAICNNNAIVIHQHNGGLSAARNSGLEIVNTEFITYVDSDDCVDEHFFVRHYECFCDEIGIVKSQIKETNYCSDMVLNSCNACINLYKNAAISIPICVVSGMYKASVIKDLRFPTGKIHEDQAYTPYALYNARQIRIIPDVLYVYRVREDSITHERFNIKRFDDIDAIDNAIAFFESQKEFSIVNAANESRDRLLAAYNIYALYDEVQVPEQFYLSKIKALNILRNKCSKEKFEYCLNMVHPKLVRPYEYYIKFMSMVKK